VQSTTAAESPTILVVEDKPEVQDILRRTLSASGYSVLTAADGEQGLQLALDRTPDLVVLDVGLPVRDGIEVAKELRTRGFHAPVLMLTALDTVTDRVTGLDAGADDYLPKPFDYKELLARVKALLRRSALRATDVMLKVGDLVIDPLSRHVSRAGKPVTLTAKEYALLEYLMRNAGRLLTRDQISEQVWKQPFDSSTNIVDVYVSYLRQKIDDPSLGPPMVHTVRGQGYMLSEPRGGSTPGRGPAS
jgi:DNA-binding response OmpR family regulator